MHLDPQQQISNWHDVHNNNNNKHALTHTCTHWHTHTHTHEHTNMHKWFMSTKHCRHVPLLNTSHLPPTHMPIPNWKQTQCGALHHNCPAQRGLHCTDKHQCHRMPIGLSPSSCGGIKPQSTRLCQLLRLSQVSWLEWHWCIDCTDPTNPGTTPNSLHCNHNNPKE